MQPGNVINYTAPSTQNRTYEKGQNKSAIL